MNSRTISIAILWFLAHSAYGAEYIQAERVAPTTALEDADALEIEFEEVEEKRLSLLTKLRERKAARGSFTRDATYKFKPRLYDFDRRNFFDQEGHYFTGGGSLEVHSGRYRDVISVGLTYSYATDINTRKDDISVGLLPPNGDSLSVLSEAFVRLDKDDSELSATFYRQSFNLPYLNRQDSRMIHNTFEAYRLDYSTEKVDMVAAYVHKMKRQNDDRFVSMSKRAGSDDSNGVVVTGFRLDLEPFHFGAVNYYSKDTINIFYLDTNLKGSYSNGIDYQIRTQLTDQRSVGNEGIGDFQTWHWGASVIGSWQDIVVNLKYTITGNDAAIRSPWGGRPHYLSLMLQNFDRAGEQASGVTISYSLGRFKLPELSLSTSYADGRDAQDIYGIELEDEQEFDITLDYKPASNRLKGLWVRLRYAEAERGDRDRRDVRAIINYPVTLY